MNNVPSLDTHSHINVTIPSHELDMLSAVIFAMTRSLEEAQQAMDRSDNMTIWGVGCHPNLSSAHKSFTQELFSKLIEHTPLVGELGLDGKSRVPMSLQQQTLSNALQILTGKSRLVSLHSYSATKEILDELEKKPIKGVILHWWLGSEEETRHAVSLGCFFSINASSVRKVHILNKIPFDRILTETDHPYGDKFSSSPQRPGNISFVENLLAQHYGTTNDAIRNQIWKNFGKLVQETGTYRLIPKKIRIQLAAI